MEKYKILLISDHALSPSGVGTQSRFLAHGLIQKGCWTFRQLGGALKHEDYTMVKAGEDFLIKPVDISHIASATDNTVDISDPENLQEIAYYDFSDIEGLYVSNWGVYAYLPSGYFISSDIEQGLFITELGGISIAHQPITDIDISEDGPYIAFVADVESFNGPVEEVTLHYSLDNVNWETFNMSYVSGNTYNLIYTPDQEGILIY